MWPKLEDIVIIITILSPGCQQPFLIKMASDNRLSAAVFGPKWLVTTGCQQPLPKNKLVNNSTEGNITPALGEMTTVCNVGEAKPGHGACMKSMSRTN